MYSASSWTNVHHPSPSTDKTSAAARTGNRAVSKPITPRKARVRRARGRFGKKVLGVVGIAVFAFGARIWFDAKADTTPDPSSETVATTQLEGANAPIVAPPNMGGASTDTTAPIAVPTPAAADAATAKPPAPTPPAPAADASAAGSKLAPPPADGCVGSVCGPQLAHASTIVQKAIDSGLGPRVYEIAIATALQESGLHNRANSGRYSETVPLADAKGPNEVWDGADQDSVGLFQQRPESGWGAPIDLMDPGYAAQAFLNAFGKVVPGAIPNWEDPSVELWRIAYAVQKCAEKHAQEYQKWEAQAREIVAYVLQFKEAPPAPEPTIQSRAAEILALRDSGRITFDVKDAEEGDGPGALADIKRASRGELTHCWGGEGNAKDGIELKLTLLTLIVKLAQPVEQSGFGHTFRISSLVSDHTGPGGCVEFNHPNGKAVDFGEVDGVYLGDNGPGLRTEAVRQFVLDASSLMPEGGWVGQLDEIGVLPLENGVTQGPDGPDHLHFELA